MNKLVIFGNKERRDLFVTAVIFGDCAEWNDCNVTLNRHDKTATEFGFRDKIVRAKLQDEYPDLVFT